MTWRDPHDQNKQHMRQRYHTIIKPDRKGFFVGWVEEIPGAITHGKTLDECRENLREALRLLLETHRDEARLALDNTCLQESLEIELQESSVSTHLA